jgi:aspartate kinase
MRVFKFGGASVKNAEAVRNVAEILKEYSEEKLIVVISAMGKTTNLLENIIDSWYYGSSDIHKYFKELKKFHFDIIEELIADDHNPIYNDIENLLLELECLIEKEPDKELDYDFYYDQIIGYGEFMSTKIISNYLLSDGIKNKWVDARNFIITDSNYRDARIDWNSTKSVIQSKLKPFIEKNLVITQGFIGKSRQNTSTSLGREGSDYTAAIFAYCLDSSDVSIWKDVDGVMNADPKRFSDVTKLDGINYNQAIELAYYGASVIHPKTIQPLKTKKIPLIVRSFVNRAATGTTVTESDEGSTDIPCIIVKNNQAMLHLSTKDFSFIVEDHLREIFASFAKYRIRVNLMQNSAISFILCIDAPKRQEKINALVDELSNIFKTEFIKELELVTIYGDYKDDNKIVRSALNGKNVVLEQKHESVSQFILAE